MSKPSEVPSRTLNKPPRFGGRFPQIAESTDRGNYLYKHRRSLRRSAAGLKTGSDLTQGNLFECDSQAHRARPIVQTAIDLGAPWREK